MIWGYHYFRKHLYRIAVDTLYIDEYRQIPFDTGETWYNTVLLDGGFQLRF